MLVGVAGIPGGHWSGTLQPTKGKSGRDAQLNSFGTVFSATVHMLRIRTQQFDARQLTLYNLINLFLGVEGLHTPTPRAQTPVTGFRSDLVAGGEIETF
eukprot:g11904.t1